MDLNVAEIGLVPYLANNGTETVTEFSERIEPYCHQWRLFRR